MVSGGNIWAMFKDLVYNNVLITQGAGAPVDGTTGDNVTGKGSLYIDRTNGILYINTGTISAPTWTKVGTQV
jgi:hypothetical protein